ncbi:MAG: GDP-mannose 4,6-dehydratase, partial [Verrucomicrobiae bacterium]|nr:GDP-mannose 4,6-dehydratase [Verrucomicrobiae bacterium]
NVHGTCTLLECSRHYLREHPAAAAAFRFLHLSTDEVFGSLGERGCFTAGSTYAPRSPYSASKAAADQLVRAWHATYGMPSIIVHSSNAYGPYQFPEKLIPHALLKAIQGEPIPIYGHGEQIREWLHVEDLAAALHAALTMAKPGSTYLIGSGEEMRNLDLVESLCAILDDLVDNGELDP